MMLPTKPPEGLQHRVYDAAGERIIRELPPGLYWVCGRPASMLVVIDHEHRARTYRFVPGSTDRRWRPYPGRGPELLRVPGVLWAYTGWPVGEQLDGANGYDEAREATPWAYEILERLGRSSSLFYGRGDGG